MKGFWRPAKCVSHTAKAPISFLKQKFSTVLNFDLRPPGLQVATVSDPGSLLISTMFISSLLAFLKSLTRLVALGSFVISLLTLFAILDTLDSVLFDFTDNSIDATVDDSFDDTFTFLLLFFVLTSLPDNDSFSIDLVLFTTTLDEAFGGFELFKI